MRFIGSKEVVVQFVDAILVRLRTDSLSITITTQEKSEGYSVLIVTDTSSEGTVAKLAQNFSGWLTNTS